MFNSFILESNLTNFGKNSQSRNQSGVQFKSLEQINLRYNLGKKYFDKSKYSEAKHIFQEIVAHGNPLSSSLNQI